MAGTAGADMCQPPSIFVQTGRNVSVTISTFSHLRWPQTTRDGGAVQLKLHGCLLAVQRRCRASTATAAAVGWPVDSPLWVPTARARGAAASDRAAQADGCRTAQAWGGGGVGAADQQHVRRGHHTIGRERRKWCECSAPRGRIWKGVRRG